MPHAHAWIRLSLLIPLALLTGCETGSSSSAVTPTIVEYSPAFQNKAADELQVMHPPCALDVILPGCSALHRMILDYGDMRNRVRAIRND